MALAAGTRLGPYELLAPLGSGGMGEVYRARDTRLDRDVAIKVLPSHVAFDPEARARFEREAKAVAALSHPNILAIHDVGTSNEITYAVMELLSGETLRARLGNGAAATGAALPARKAIDIAVQVARGLSAAHGKGIVHRDLKPENIFLTADGHAKILDFGLAKVTERKGGSGAENTERGSGSNAATELRATDPGTVMGTAGYMAPEQVRGHEVDHRADIFAFGCVLYEMLTGRRTFLKDTAAETMTAVLKEDAPSLAASGAPVPAALDGVVRHCLEKQPDDRFQSARDLTFALESASGLASGAAPAVATAARRSGIGRWAAATALISTITGVAVWAVMRASPPTPARAPSIRAELALPELTLPFIVGKDDSILALSPDGRWLATVTADHTAIVLHNLESGESRVLVEGGEVGEPIFSPNGQFVAFVQGGGGTIRSAVWGALKKVALSGGAATVIAPSIIGIKGATWSADGYIYYCPAPGMGLWRANADRPGTPEMLTDPDASQGEKTHRHPFALPGGRALLFTVGTSRITSFDDARIEAIDLKDKSRHRLIDGGTSPRYLPTGHLLYERAGQLLAVGFDPDSLTIKGSPVVVAEGVANLAVSGTSYHAVSDSGLLMFIPAGPVPAGQILAVDRNGKATKLADAPTQLTSGNLSKDGKRLALDPDGATQQIAIIDLARNLPQQVTYEWDNANPLWTDDQTRLVFRANIGGGRRRVYWQAADGSGKPERLTPDSKDATDEIPTSVRGRIVVYENLDPVTKTDIWTISLDDRTPKSLVRTPFDESGGRLSPDGAWLSYQSNQSGHWEIWAQPYPGPGTRLQVSQGGGVRAMWMPDSRTIVFQRGSDLMSATIGSVGGSGGVGTPAKIFGLEPNDMLLDVASDGRVLLRRTTNPPSPPVRLIVNWFESVRDAMKGR